MGGCNGCAHYFAPSFTAHSIAHAIARAAADGVAVLLNGWGGRIESDWKDEEIKEINAALEQAARQHITVIVGAGNKGVTDGAVDRHRHVDFPASSPWVLSVGGTALKSEGGRITSETVWRAGTELGATSSATGGGVSEKFERPDWQAAVSVPNRDDGRLGRGIPDVAASADPMLGVELIVRGSHAVFGGTEISAALWAGLIARIDQALGYNVGYINPRLYRDIGPEGVFRAITIGDNGVAGVKGYSAGPGSSPVAGWGSPNGIKLLNWLREHPNPPGENKVATVACRPNSR